MEHVVFFTGPDGGSHFRRTPDLEEAVRFVEHLRNVEGVDDSKVYSLTEIPVNFRAYYRVEVGADGISAEAPAMDVPGLEAAPVAAAPPPPPLATGEVPLTDAAAAAFDGLPAAPGAETEGGDGPRSLSFFSG